MRKLIRMLSCTAMMLLFSTLAFATVNDDQVTSQKIKEADGTSGQNTNSGSGVKTGHIQDGAVTTSKIAVSAVTSSVIASGAVTNAKITGPISAAKISSTGLNADTVDGKHAADLAPAVHAHPTSQVTGLDAALAGKAEVLHNHDNLYQQKYGRVAVVAQTGGDYTSPYDAAINYMDWCPTPYAGNPCLIKVMPGVYDIGATAVYLPPYIDLEGSGENVTVIKGAGVSPPGVGDLNVYQVISGDGATGVNEVRSLTVENYGTVNAPTSTGIANISAISNVRVTVAV